MGAEISDTSCDVHVLVDEAAEAIASQRPDGRAGAWGIGSGGRLLLEEPVRPVGVVAAPRGAALYRPRSGQGREERSLDLMADPGSER